MQEPQLSAASKITSLAPSLTHNLITPILCSQHLPRETAVDFSPSCAHLRAFSSLALAYLLSSYTPEDPRLMVDCLEAIMSRLVDDVFGVRWPHTSRWRAIQDSVRQIF